MWQLELRSQLSCGVGNLEKDLTTFPNDPLSRSKRRGPQPELSDAQLHDRREQLVQVFEGSWGEIGGELRKCKKPADLSHIFRLLDESYVWQLVEVLCRPSTEQASPTHLRKIRAEMRALVEPNRAAGQSQVRAQEQLQRADWALERAPSDKRRMLKRERKKRRKEAWRALQGYQTLSDTVRRLETRLKSREAAFARQELFRFLKSKRYEVTPLALANAAAGIPYMGWRHSMRKNTKVRSIAANGIAYQVFKAIRYLAAISNKKTEKEFVTDFGEHIPSLPSRYGFPKNELVDNWLYLERAIRQAYRMKPHPRDLPFEITKRYFRQIRSQSNVDMVLAKQASLRLISKPMKKVK